MASRQFIACLLVQAATGLVAPTKQALRVAEDLRVDAVPTKQALRVAEGGGAEDWRVDAAAALPVHAASTTTRPPTTASLYSGSVAAKATPALPNAEAPPPVRALVTFAGVVAGAAAIGFDVELAAVAAGAAAVFSALDYYSPVGQLERSVGRLDRLSSDGAKESDGVTDAIQGDALELAVDATEAAAPHAPAAAAAPPHAPPAAPGAPPAPAAARKSRKLYSVGEETPAPGREREFHKAQEQQWDQYEAAAPLAAPGAPPAPAAARKSRKLYSVGEETPAPGREREFHEAQEQQWDQYEAAAPPAAPGAPPAPATARQLYSVGEEMPAPGREQDFEAHKAQERQWAEYEAAQQRQTAQYQAAQERQYAQTLSAAMTTEVLYQKLEQARLDLMGSTTVETATPLVALIKDITAAIANVERLY